MPWEPGAGSHYKRIVGRDDSGSFEHIFRVIKSPFRYRKVTTMAKETNRTQVMRLDGYGHLYDVQRHALDDHIMPEFRPKTSKKRRR